MAERSPWRRYPARLGVGLLILLPLPFVLHALDRGWSLGDPLAMAQSRLFHPGAALGNIAIHGHMVLGGVLTLLAPLQLVSVVRRRWPRLHHWNGRIVASAAILTGLGGLIYIVGHGTIGGWSMSFGFALYGLLMIVVALLAIRTAMARSPDHPLWAGHLVILALASWIYRVHYGLWVGLVGEVATNPDFTGTFDRVQNWAFYLPYMAIWHLIWLRRRAKS
ncbi:MAG: DUF2306 domain-containing protein [Pseudomonadota bacterium]